ncbi:MAG: histidine--tRNA ligase [Candidatus Brennerbacteria bacterium]|nr:histidine--tRNA ligase [Candidatus Brennerbacteria bacterium]
MKKIKKTGKSDKKPKKELFQSPRGMADILPVQQPWWDKLIGIGQELAGLYDFGRIETPILEFAGIFEKSLGEATEVLEKQMFIVKTKGGDRLAMRPETTASVMRAYFQHHLSYGQQPFKVYSFGPMFRYEHPQAGRFRQFHQFNFDIIGDTDPLYDAQIILLFWRFLQLLKIPGLTPQVNTVGCRVCRQHYLRRLKEYYGKLKNKICKDCQRRLEINPLRLFDCKEEQCLPLKAAAPNMLDNLCQACNSHFRAVLEHLEENKFPYEPNPFLVRGLDYYSRTFFEIFGGSEKTAIAAGGRYDYLSEMIGPRLVPAVGGALGMERVIEIIKSESLFIFKAPVKIYFITIGEQAKKCGLRVMEELRHAGVKIAESLGKDSLKAQLGAADKMKAKLVLIFGQKEVFEETIIIRDMASGAQENIALSRVVEEVKKRLR